MLRELFTTGHARWPDRHYTMGVRSDRLQEFLKIVGNGGALLLRADEFVFVYGENRITTGPVQLYAPHTRLTNRDGLEAAIGSGTDPQARWECADGTVIRISRITDELESVG